MNKLLAWLALFPKLLKAIIEIEDALPLPGIGADKQALLIAVIKAVYEAEESIRREFDWAKLVELIGKVSAVIVALLKSAGVFNGKEHPSHFP